MCLLALAYRVHPRYPLVLVGNRDEFHHRAALPLSLWPAPSPIVGGQDCSSGGAWLAATASGRLGAVTNVRRPQPPAGNARSRGGLIPQFLNGNITARDATQQWAGASAEYAPFNLLLYDLASGLHFVSNQTSAAQALAPGVHSVSNATLNSPWPKSLRVQAALTAWLAAAPKDTAQPPDLSALFIALADPTPAADAELPNTGVGQEWEKKLSSPFIKGSDYGTRASSVLCIAANGLDYFEERSFGPNAKPLTQRIWTPERGLQEGVA